jgi:hypothetical protein
MFLNFWNAVYNCVHISKAIFQNDVQSWLLNKEVSTRLVGELFSFAVLYSVVPRIETMLLPTKFVFQFQNLPMANCE